MEEIIKTSAKVNNLTRFKLERHVKEAFRTALLFSGGKPVNASHMLKSVLIVNKKDSSPAFIEFASILRTPSITPISEPFASKITADLAAMPFTEPMSESLLIAERFIQDNNTFWGRDYITAALLAVNDPSLNEITIGTGLTVKQIQDKWYHFVSADQRRRTIESWQQWWQTAGVPLPDIEQQKQVSFPAYMLTWNPKKFPWPELEDNMDKIENQGYLNGIWSMGNRKNVIIGARVYLLREGLDPRGIVGTGLIDSHVFEDTALNKKREKDSGNALYSKIKWEALSREPILDRSELIAKFGEQKIWFAQASGIEIEHNLANEIAALWKTAWERHQKRNIYDKPRQWIARFNADTGSKGDQLRIDRYVNAFARVIASVNLSPPLSIGLFGDWGSGKTFFMDLLYDKVRELSKEEQGIDPPLYLRFICQIRFNTWHYAETNLWASLVSTIFNHLRFYFDGDKTNSDEFNKLLNKLEVARELRKEADEKLQEAEEELQKAKELVKKAEEKFSQLPDKPKLSENELRKILSKSVGEIFTDKTHLLSDLFKSAGEITGRKDLTSTAGNIEKGITTVNEVNKLMKETGLILSRTGFWWQILSTAKIYKSKMFWVIVSILVAIPAISIYYSSESWPHIWAAILEILTAGSAVITWIRSRLTKADNVFNQLDSFQKSIEEKIEDARFADRRNYETELNNAVKIEKDAQDELEKARREVQMKIRSEEEARRALKESTSEVRLGQFIRERASSADYDKHLGLIAMVHRDFQRLSDIMEKMHKIDGDLNLKRIERIVLYIDDLDRCRPEKVVQVLEAIHLLLFFPLFVVVVGVDSRWISRALSKHYDEMLADETRKVNNTKRGSDRAPAESQNYLEKIFQVPFWLRKMDPSAVTRLIRSLITEEEIETTPKITSKVRRVDDLSVSGLKEILEKKPDDPAFAEKKRMTGEAEIGQDNLGEPLSPPTESLTITDIELDYMNEIAPLMPRTPRSIKRFVNIYRFYKAGLSTPALGRFLGTRERPGNFRAVQVLLALVTGEPHLAQLVFSELLKDGSADKKLSSLVEVLEKGDETWKITLEALRDFAIGDNDIKLSELQQVSALVGRYSVHHMVSPTPGESGLG